MPFFFSLAAAYATIFFKLVAENSSQNLIQPLGAGDLIDRAIRLYRQNFWTFIWIASPPIIAATLFSLAWVFLGRYLFNKGPSNNFDDTSYVLFNWFGNTAIWYIEAVATLIVMGGASRNFVRYLLFFEPFTFKETYSNVKKRLLGLSIFSMVTVLLLGIFGIIVFYFAAAFCALAIFLAALLAETSKILAFIVGLVLVLAILFAAGLFFFFIASRLAYVPQIMLVEGQSISSAMGRSMSLASGNVKRFAALFTFTILATYSALSVLYVPLGWYAYAQGVEIFSFDSDLIPMWYIVASQLISQASFILLSPIWMLGLSLLYVDERVRHEGYDVELLAARNLGEIPPLPPQYMNPLQPALSNQLTASMPLQSPAKSRDNSILGLN